MIKTVYLTRCKRGVGFYNLNMDQNVILGCWGPFDSRPAARIEAMKTLHEEPESSRQAMG